MFLLALTGREARAQEPGQAPAAELAALEQQLEAELASTTSEDCAVACRALESMIRSAERICELDPGPRCDAAREKVAAAKRRIRERCPDCAAASEEEMKMPPAAPTEEVELEEGELAGPAAGPPPADKAGGCAACAFEQRDDDAGMAWLLLTLALAALRRGRRRARR